ncbi:hypothetical protein SKAU_G00177840 [Synaphobranchus kaupii]|uniref:Uncharacterized protein n=1 Tax=Synaphobranchus kaupii TaxID=118154 RepID=A0A9Q1IZ83_SYNKA|nr:hypothetical protein SKAU_G00177840 [Synaphobranchus kaupii]
MEAFIQLLPCERRHGWAHHIRILTTVYWLAHALSYSMVCRAFNIPKNTVWQGTRVPIRKDRRVTVSREPIEQA